MGAFIIRRLVLALAVVMIVSFISFMLIQLIPGDPVVTMLGLDATPQQIEKMRAELWLDRPLVVQYGHWLGNFLKGDMGKSVMYREDVTTLIAKRVPITFHLATLAFLMSITLGVTAGVISAVKRGSVLDQAITIIANIGIGIPIFWLGILGIYGFGLKLGWLPIQGYTNPFDDFWLSTRQLVMPVIAMAVIPIAMMARQGRSSMLEVIQQGYIQTARAKGLEERVVITRHALKNALIPIVTLLGLSIGRLLGGAVIIETVFNIPGMGRLLVSAVFDKDFVIVQAGVFIIALTMVLSNLIVDISYGWLDPRIRYE